MRYGLFVWKLSSIPAAQALGDLCLTYGISALAFKVQNGIGKSNQVAGADPDSKLLEMRSVLLSMGIEYHGWSYLYSLPAVDPVKQAVVTTERVQKLGLQSLMIDIEEADGSGWKTSPYRARSAKTYLDALKTPPNFPIGLCSYRYPSLHTEMPFDIFLAHPRVNQINQQLYWMQAHNPGQQLARSFAEYKAMTSKVQYPLGAMFREYGWEPTAADVIQFVKSAESMTDIVWFWCLDDVMVYKHFDWLEAAKNAVGYVPPVVKPKGVQFKMQVCSAMGLNVRSKPSTDAPVIGKLRVKDQIVVSSAGIVGKDVWVKIDDGDFEGMYACLQLIDAKFLEAI